MAILGSPANVVGLRHGDAGLGPWMLASECQSPTGGLDTSGQGDVLEDQIERALLLPSRRDEEFDGQTVRRRAVVEEQAIADRRNQAGDKRRRSLGISSTRGGGYWSPRGTLQAVVPAAAFRSRTFASMRRLIASIERGGMRETTVLRSALDQTSGSCQRV